VTKCIEPVRYAELARTYLVDHESISNRELRELLGLGESTSAQVEASKYLRKWSGPAEFLEGFGTGKRRRYRSRRGT
jgi:ATP-dependent DNA helicase RecG